MLRHAPFSLLLVGFDSRAPVGPNRLHSPPCVQNIRTLAANQTPRTHLKFRASRVVRLQLGSAVPYLGYGQAAQHHMRDRGSQPLGTLVIFIQAPATAEHVGMACTQASAKMPRREIARCAAPEQAL